MRLLAPVCLCLLVAACGGSGSGPSAPQAPSVSLLAPADGAVVQGTVTVTASAERADRLRFFVDDVEIGFDEVAPFTVIWNSASTADGPHVIRATAEGTGGVTADEVSVTVRNEGATDPVVVTVTPANAVVETGKTRAFSAVVTGTTNGAVTWTVDGGATFGSITPDGLYTAPATRPDPASAVVRATSVADPTRSATAAVTIAAPGGVTVPRSALLQTFAAGTDVALFADEIVNQAVDLVFVASIANGGTLTLTGTLTENPQDPSGFSWTPAPTDRMVVGLSGAGTIELVFSAFSGFIEGDARDFVEFHSDLDFTIAWAGTADLRIRSASGNPGAAPGRAGAAAPASTIVFQRQIDGTVSASGETITVHLVHGGERLSDIGPNIDFTSQETTIGTIDAPSGTITVDAFYRYRLVRVDHFVENVTRSSESRLVSGADTWTFTGAIVRTAFFDNRVSDTDFWVAQGSLGKNGTPVASLRFDGPVVDGAPFPGPGIELAIGDGSVVPLAPSPLRELSARLGGRRRAAF